VIVETSREAEGALLVATAWGGSGVDASAAPPFAFDRDRDRQRFTAYLCDGSGAVLVTFEGRAVQVAWVGALEALVLRDGEVMHRTTPQLAHLPRALVNWTLDLTSFAREPGVDLAGPWLTEPGDLVLLCSANVHQALSEADVTGLASRDDLATIVRGLVTTTSTRGDFVELCAVAIRIVAA
jgi:hypothetical protein